MPYGEIPSGFGGVYYGAMPPQPQEPIPFVDPSFKRNWSYDGGEHGRGNRDARSCWEKTGQVRRESIAKLAPRVNEVEAVNVAVRDYLHKVQGRAEQERTRLMWATMLFAMTTKVLMKMMERDDIRNWVGWVVADQYAKTMELNLEHLQEEGFDSLPHNCPEYTNYSNNRQKFIQNCLAIGDEVSRGSLKTTIGHLPISVPVAAAIPEFRPVPKDQLAVTDYSYRLTVDATATCQKMAKQMGEARVIAENIPYVKAFVGGQIEGLNSYDRGYNGEWNRWKDFANKTYAQVTSYTARVLTGVAANTQLLKDIDVWEGVLRVERKEHNWNQALLSMNIAVLERIMARTDLTNWVSWLIADQYAFYTKFYIDFGSFKQRKLTALPHVCPQYADYPLNQANFLSQSLAVAQQVKAGTAAATVGDIHIPFTGLMDLPSVV